MIGTLYYECTRSEGTSGKVRSVATKIVGNETAMVEVSTRVIVLILGQRIAGTRGQRERVVKIRCSVGLKQNASLNYR